MEPDLLKLMCYHRKEQTLNVSISVQLERKVEEIVAKKWLRKMYIKFQEKMSSFECIVGSR